MASTTKRRFTEEFKREAVALWETSGRMQIEVAAELAELPKVPAMRSIVGKAVEGSCHCGESRSKESEMTFDASAARLPPRVLSLLSRLTAITTPKRPAG